MMAPSVDPDSVDFYEDKDFSGAKHTYRLGDDVSLPGSLNDKFLSLNVGVAAKVIAWQHYSLTGIYREWTGPHSDISDIDGLSRFTVVTNDTRAIAFLFRDATGGRPKQFSLKVDARDVGAVTLFSGDGDDNDYRLVGIIAPTGPPITTAVFLRNEETGQYLAVGSVFFQWDEVEEKVVIVESENWPSQLRAEQTGPSAFVVTLVDDKPSD